jgi:hypothetical protein
MVDLLTIAALPQLCTLPVHYLFGTSRYHRTEFRAQCYATYRLFRLFF